ncbi:MAG TPA: antitoxin Xre/MbcA/ParS toxin-binding domain-containing protein [Rhodoblastus sp.]|nr:antitoxin Xre/MbcA/ParS toxin-binding domain-containing protein [Rhodoblastus sp.]
MAQTNIMNTISKATELLGIAIGRPQMPEGATRGGAAIKLVETIRAGFPVESIQRMVDSGRLNAVEVDRVILPRKTLANRKKHGALTADQSDRLLRVARVIAAAEETFGDADKAHVWLRRPTTALDGETPLDLLDTEEGARAVEALLVRIAHGVAA